MLMPACSEATLPFSFTMLEAERFLRPLTSEGADTPAIPFSQWNLQWRRKERILTHLLAVPQEDGISQDDRPCNAMKEVS